MPLRYLNTCFSDLHKESPEYLVRILALVHKKLTISLPYLHANKVMHEPHVLHLKLSFKVLLERLDPLIITCQYEIINIKLDDQQFTFHHYVVQV